MSGRRKWLCNAALRHWSWRLIAVVILCENSDGPGSCWVAQECLHFLQKEKKKNCSLHHQGFTSQHCIFTDLRHESQHHSSCKRPLRSPSPTPNPTRHAADHVLSATSPPFLNTSRVSDSTAPCTACASAWPLWEAIFPNIRPPLVQLKAVPPRYRCYLGAEADPHLTTASLHGVVESHKVSPEPSPE